VDRGAVKGVDKQARPHECDSDDSGWPQAGLLIFGQQIKHADSILIQSAVAYDYAEIKLMSEILAGDGLWQTHCCWIF
jgi:hypothetical protein